jgi:hypothetical protein
MMMNVLKLGSLAIVLTSVCLAVAQDEIPVTLNGRLVHFPGQGPVMSKDRVMVPLRGVLERMGATVGWDPATQTVRATTSSSRVKLEIGDRTAIVNGAPVSMDVPAEIMDGATMVPLRFVSENLGANVRWNEKDQTVEIATGDYDVRHEHLPPPDPAANSKPMTMSTVIPAGTEIKGSLNDDISSDTNHKGDKVVVSVEGDALGLPDGTKLVGIVDGLHKKHAGHPGWLDLKFTKLILPNGKSYAVNGTFLGEGKIGSNSVHEAHFNSGTEFAVRLQDKISLGG